MRGAAFLCAATTPPDRWWIYASNDRPEPGLRKQDDPFGFPYDGQDGA